MSTGDPELAVGEFDETDATLTLLDESPEADALQDGPLEVPLASEEPELEAHLKARQALEGIRDPRE